MNAIFMGATPMQEITMTPEEEREFETALRKEAEEKESDAPAIIQWLQTGPAKLVSWLGNNEIHVGDTLISTEQGKLTVKTGATQQELARMQTPGAVTWWEGMPNYVKYGVPALALFLLLRK